MIAIIGILIAVAIPSYRSYTRRAHYTEIVQAAGPYKLGVEECFQLLGDLSDCSAGQNGIPPAIVAGEGSGLVDSIEVKNNGVITITPQAKFGITPEQNYILTPNAAQGKLLWTTSGGAVMAGYVH